MPRCMQWHPRGETNFVKSTNVFNFKDHTSKEDQPGNQTYLVLFIALETPHQSH